MSIDANRVEIKSTVELRAWLKANCHQTESVWLIRYKKSIEEFYVDYSSVVDELLCFGWIDSPPKSLDSERTMLRISPRKPSSAWSKINRDKVEALVKSRKMTKAGMAIVNQAKLDGSWDKLKSIDGNKIPPDLADAFIKSPKAKTQFDRFPPSSVRGILEWISLAKTDETRKKRILETVELAAKGIRANHPKKKLPRL